MKKIDITVTKPFASYKKGDTVKVVRKFAELVIGKGWAVEGAPKKGANAPKKDAEEDKPK